MTLQVVCMRWGEYYGANYVNGLFRAITRTTSHQVRFVCFTDDDDDDRERYDDGIIVRPIPDIGIPLNELKNGCRAKLAIFQEGALEPDLKTIFLDLDTMINGDIAALTDNLGAKDQLYMLGNHLVPFWRADPVVSKIFTENYYYANSSIMAFYPENFYWLVDKFKESMRSFGHLGIAGLRKHGLTSDDRFISKVARGKIRIFSSSEAALFKHEYMLPILPVAESVRRQLPWVHRKRRNIVALTFAGAQLKPHLISRMERGRKVSQKGNQVYWHYDDIQDYWKRIELMRSDG